MSGSYVHFQRTAEASDARIHKQEAVLKRIADKHGYKLSDPFKNESVENVPLIHNTPEEKILKTIMVALNNFYSRVDGQRVKEGLKRKTRKNSLKAL